jgi:hypothetical protein
VQGLCRQHFYSDHIVKLTLFLSYLRRQFVLHIVVKCEENHKWVFKSALSGSDHSYMKGTSQKLFGGTEDNIPIWTASSQ